MLYPSAEIFSARGLQYLVMVFVASYIECKKSSMSVKIGNNHRIL